MLLKFEMIADTRFGESLETLSVQTEEVLVRLKPLPVKVDVLGPQRFTFQDGEIVQWRNTFYVLKLGRVEWVKVKRAVNSVKPARYEMV